MHAFDVTQFWERLEHTLRHSAYNSLPTDSQFICQLVSCVFVLFINMKKHSLFHFGSDRVDDLMVV